MKPLNPEYATNDSPVDSDWREAAPRCSECKRAIDEDTGCTDSDCLAERAEAAGESKNDSQSLRRAVLADFVTCPHYDHAGVDCPLVDAALNYKEK